MVSVNEFVILYKSFVTLVFDHTNYNRNGGLKMGWIITLIVGAIIGIIASSITGKSFPGGMFGNIIAGLLGASLGSRLFGSFGPSFGGIHVVPALLGAIVLILIVSFVVKAARK
jgi:uncharacterized membrane protein YeaQ/YmgE (transglycosylase-associated protein family)